MGTEFWFKMRTEFWSWVVVLVPQQCETTIPLNLLSKIVKMVNVMLCIFSTIEIIKKCQLTIKMNKTRTCRKVNTNGY